MRNPSQVSVVVGVNGTSAALAAVRLAAREAVSRAGRLRVIHAFTWPDPLTASAGTGYDGARRAASRILEEAVATAQRSTPGTEVRGHLVDGPPGRVLLRLSRGAALLVLGGDGLAAGGRLPSWTVLSEVTTRAWCPVEVARGARPPAGPVLAAIDGSSCSAMVLRFAADAARRRGCALHAVHVMAGTGPDAEAAARQTLDRTLAAVPDLPEVRRRVLAGPPQHALVHAAHRAGLIVLGPGGGRLHARRLGSNADEVLRRGGCPAVFVHGPRIPSRRLQAPQGRSDADQVLGSTTP